MQTRPLTSASLYHLYHLSLLWPRVNQCISIAGENFILLLSPNGNKNFDRRIKEDDDGDVNDHDGERNDKRGRIKRMEEGRTFHVIFFITRRTFALSFRSFTLDNN